MKHDACYLNFFFNKKKIKILKIIENTYRLLRDLEFGFDPSKLLSGILDVPFEQRIHAINILDEAAKKFKS